MHNLYKFTQNDFPFPYNQCNWWKSHRFIALYVHHYIDYEMAKTHILERAKTHILRTDDGAILNALETTERHLSQNEVNDILARHNLTKDEYVKKI